MMRIGIPERKVPNTGINQKINTISERVNIKGNADHPWTKLIIRSPMLVSMAFVSAMID
jgi:hypothetical protein